MEISIIGGTGSMGHLINKFLTKQGYSVNIFDSNLSNFSKIIQKTDLIIVSVPKSVIPEVIKKLGKENLDKKAVISFSSYLSDEIDLLKGLKTDYAFVHLMFGPSVEDFNDQNILVTKHKNKFIKEFVSLLEKSGANVVSTSVAEHDSLMTYVQALSQFNSLVLAKTVSESGFDLNKIKNSSSITFRLNLEIINRIIKQDPKMWSAIQFSNTKFRGLLESHIDNIKLFENIVKNKKSISFDKEFKSIKKFFEKEDVDISKEEIKEKIKKQKQAGDIGVLGPEGTYSHEAAWRYKKNKSFSFYKTVEDVVEALAKGEVKEAVLPLENSIHGTYVPTLDGIFNNDLRIKEEFILDINHVAAGVLKGLDRNNVRNVFSHPQALAQCKSNIKKLYPNATVEPVNSTAGSLKDISETKDKTSVGIGSQFAANLYKLNVVDKDLADVKNNQTLFVVATSKNQGKTKLKSTLIAFSPNVDTVGMLADIAKIFKDNNVNLSKIESRPSRKKLGTYIFYIKLDIEPSNPRLRTLYKKMEELGVTIKQLSV